MLVNVPLCDQLQPTTNDGWVSNNAQADCVAASLDAAAKGLGRALDRTPDWWKDSAYSEQYTGATDPMHYAGVCASLGLQLTQLDNASGDALVAAIRADLAAGLPVLGAIPSQWGLDYSGQNMVQFGGSTHEVCFCDDSGGNLVAMNPWHGFYQSMPYAWWAERLVYGHINPLRGVAMWTKQPDGTGRDGQGHTCGTGCMSYLAGSPLAAADGLMSEQYRGSNDAVLPLSNGHCVTARHDPATGQWTITQDDAGGLALLCGLLADARAAQAPPPPPPAPAATPLQLAADQAMRAFIAALSDYAHAGATND